MSATTSSSVPEIPTPDVAAATHLPAIAPPRMHPANALQPTPRPAGACGARREDADEWGRLMVAGRDGNGGAYNRLLREIASWLRRFYARRLPAAMIDDVVQEALMAIHRKRHTYVAGRPFRPWLAAIARYKGIDRLRAHGRERTEPFDDHDAALPDHGPTVIGRLALEALLGNLKPSQAGVIRLVKIGGHSIEDAAAVSGQSISLVKVNISRGIARMSKMIDGGEDGAAGAGAPTGIAHRRMGRMKSSGCADVPIAEHLAVTQHANGQAAADPRRVQ